MGMTKKQLEAELLVHKKALARYIRDNREKCPPTYWGKPCPGPGPSICIKCWMDYEISVVRNEHI